MKKFSVIVLAISLFVLGCQNGGSVKDKSIKIDEGAVLAKVGNENITEKRLNLELERIPNEYKEYYSSDEGKEEVIERLREIKMLELDAIEAGLEKNEDVIMEIKVAREQILASKMVKKYLEDNIKFTNEEISTNYENNKEKYKQKLEVKASHILIKTNAQMTKEEKDKAKVKAEEILAKAKENIDGFADLAKESSEGPSAPNGGQLGWFSKGQMVKPFEEAAFSAEKGEVFNEIVETQFGYHIIYVEDKKEEGYITFDEVKANIEDEMRSEKSNDVYQEYINKLKAKYSQE